MILTGQAIQKAVREGSITISPFQENQVNPNSYNYRLGPDVYEVQGNTIDPKVLGTYKQLTAQQDGSYLLQPNRLYLGSTLEVIGSDTYVPSLIGRSSVGRLGLFLQITADLGQLGKAHRWTLEMKVINPLKIYPGMKIGQISFWETTGKHEASYQARYTLFNAPALYLEGNI